MKPRGSTLSAFLAAVPLGFLVTAPISAPAQQMPPLPFAYTSRNSAIISQQISIALQYDKQALDLLANTAASPESAESIKSLVSDSYVLLRYAHAGVVQVASQNQFLNALTQIEDDLLEQARAELRECMAALDHIRAGVSQDIASEVASATDSLTKAMMHLETLQVVRR